MQCVLLTRDGDAQVMRPFCSQFLLRVCFDGHRIWSCFDTQRLRDTVQWWVCVCVVWVLQLRQTCSVPIASADGSVAVYSIGRGVAERGRLIPLIAATAATAVAASTRDS